MATAAKRQRFDGDRFALGTFHLRFGFIESETGNALSEVMKAIPDYLCSDEPKLSVVEVGYWTMDENGDDARPHDLTTLYEITHYEDPSEEDDDD